MTQEDKDLLVRIAPVWIAGAALAVYSFVQIRNLNRQRKQSEVEHKAKMADMEVAAKERIERFHAWRASQPNIDEIMDKVNQEVGSLEDVCRKMDDPNHVWEL